MKYLSVCSGIEAATVAWQSAGWQPVAFAEIEPFPCAVLKHHYPSVPNWGDVTKFHDWPDAAFDVLVGGTPCQSFSVAGLRAGLADPRGNLALTYLAVLDRYRPHWCCWENVPGVLSADDGGALGAFLGGLGQLGYGFAYRVLDAQYFGLAQRRARVFVVGCLGDWRRAAAVLFERESLSGHPPPRREAGQRVAPTIGGCSNGGGANGPGRSADDADGLIELTGRSERRDVSADGHGRNRLERQPLGYCETGQGWWTEGLAGLRADPGGMPENIAVTHSLRADGFDASEDGTGRGTPIVPIQSVQAVREKKQNGIGIGDSGDPMFTLTGRDQHAVAQPFTLAIRGRGDSHDLECRQDGIANAILTPNGGRGGIGVGAIAFDTTQITHPENRSNPQPDGPAPSLAKGAHPPAIAFTNTAGDTALGLSKPGVPPITGRDGDPGNVLLGMQVRRLTPRECERLQGFPDDYTLIAYRGKPAADGPRYKALGNSMAVPVMRWIGQRIQRVADVVDADAGSLTEHRA